MPPNKRQTDWHNLLLSASRLQREVPGAVLVGGAAVALLAKHRYSTDADHVVADLRWRYSQVLQHLESLAGWSTARYSKPPVLILGSLDGKEAGVRQLRRSEPLETQVVSYAGQSLCIPTYHELLRIKAYLVLKRSYTRDYVDFLALAADLDTVGLAEALATLEDLYEGLVDERSSGKGLLFDLGSALRGGNPIDPYGGDWHHFDSMYSDQQPWDLERIRTEGRRQGDRVLTIWRQIENEQEEVDTSSASDTCSGLF